MEANFSMCKMVNTWRIESIVRRDYQIDLLIYSANISQNPVAFVQRFQCFICYSIENALRNRSRSVSMSFWCFVITATQKITLNKSNGNKFRFELRFSESTRAQDEPTSSHPSNWIIKFYNKFRKRESISLNGSTFVSLAQSQNYKIRFCSIDFILNENEFRHCFVVGYDNVHVHIYSP